MGSNCCVKNRAFSLLEIIVSIAMLSIGIVVVLRALAFSARLTGFSSDMANAVFLAEDKLQELEFQERQNLIGASPAQAQGKSGRLEWAYLLESSGGSNLRRLSLDIKWQRGSRDEALTLNTYIRE
jgi:prepilin-type N-terminal cleavage/methylation domain-containing protein